MELERARQTDRREDRLFDQFKDSIDRTRTDLTDRNYCPTRRELLAVIAALQHFRHYLLGTHVTLRTDHHSLKWLRTFKRPEGILARWIETLAEFDFEVDSTATLMVSRGPSASNAGERTSPHRG